MSQEKNGENTDLECDLILCRNMDNEKDWKPLKCGFGIGWRRAIAQSTLSNEEVLQLVGEERSLLTTKRTRQRNWI